MLHWSWEKVKGKEDKLSSGEKSDAVMGMSRTAPNVCTTPSVRKTLTSGNER